MDLNRAYEILGVTQNDDFEQIKKKYKQLCKKYHPDLYQDKTIKELTEEKLKEVNEAYTVINEYFENGSSEENNKGFSWENYYFEIDDDLDIYNRFKKAINTKVESELIKYEAMYQAYQSLETFLKNDIKIVEKIIYKIFDILVEVGIKNGYDMPSTKLLFDNYFDKVTQDYQYYYNYCLGFSDKIDTDKEYEKHRRKVNDYVKGKNGLLNSAIRGASNLYDEAEANKKKLNFYSDPETIKILKESIKVAINNCLEEVIKLLDLHLNFNTVASASIVENIKKYPADQRKEKLFYALTCNPYNEDIYYLILEYFGDKKNELEYIATYFCINGLIEYKEEMVKKKIEGFKKIILEDLSQRKYLTFDETIKLSISENTIIVSKALLNLELNKLGRNIKNYNIDKIILDEKNAAVNKELEIFRENFLEDQENAIKILKESLKGLNFNFEEKIDLEHEIREIKDKKAREAIEVFKKEALKDKVQAEVKLKNIMEKLELNLENYIDLTAEYKKIEENTLKKKKRMKVFIGIIICCIVGYFLISLVNNRELNFEQSQYQSYDYEYPIIEYYPSGRVKSYDDGGPVSFEMEDKPIDFEVLEKEISNIETIVEQKVKEHETLLQRKKKLNSKTAKGTNEIENIDDQLQSIEEYLSYLVNNGVDAVIKIHLLNKNLTKVEKQKLEKLSKRTDIYGEKASKTWSN